VIDITNFAPDHSGSGQGSKGTLEEPTTVCGHDVSQILKGNQEIPGFTGAHDGKTYKTYQHKSETINNSSTSDLKPYFVGYYDANKP
jgi:hypothetical protein